MFNVVYGESKSIVNSTGLILQNENGQEVIMMERKEAVLSPGDVIKLMKDQFHYKIELRGENSEDKTVSDVTTHIKTEESSSAKTESLR